MFSQAHRTTFRMALFLMPAIFSLAGISVQAAPKPKTAERKTINKVSLNNALFSAIQKGDLHSVQSLLARGADANARDNLRQTPLMAALGCDASNNTLPIMEALVSKKANVNAMDGNRTSVLVSAVYTGSLPVIEFLIHHGANVNLVGSYGETPLSRAISMGKTSIIKLLLDAGANVRYKGAGTLLLSAESTDNTIIAQLLVAHGASINETDISGSTPLMEAAQEGHSQVVKFLLQKGAKINLKDKTGETALLKAASYGKIESVRLLLQAGANANIPDNEGSTPLENAVISSMGQDNADIVKLLLDHGANPNLHTQSGKPLVTAAKNGERKVVELLLARGANAGATDEIGNTALMSVLTSGNMFMIRMSLYAYGATLSDQQKTEAKEKAEADDTAIVQALLDHGVNVSNFPNSTALTAAAAGGNPSIVRLLLDKGAPVNGNDAKSVAEMLAKAEKEANAQPQLITSYMEMARAETPKDITPLMAAAGGGHFEIVNMLLDAGADPNRKDTDGTTALMYLAENGSNQIARHLPSMREAILHRADDSAEKPTSREVKPAEAAAMQKWAGEGDTTIIKALLARKADLEARDNLGHTALMEAAATSSPAVVQTLIDAGAAINAQDGSGQNALMRVIENGRISDAPQLFSQELQTAVLLVNKYKGRYSKSEIDRIKSAAAQQQAKVIQSATDEDIAVIKALLTAGINLNAKDKKGQTALQMAEATHHTAIVNLLKQANQINK